MCDAKSAGDVDASQTRDYLFFYHLTFERNIHIRCHRHRQFSHPRSVPRILIILINFIFLPKTEKRELPARLASSTHSPHIFISLPQVYCCRCRCRCAAAAVAETVRRR